MNSSEKKRAVVLLSGGLDSSVALAEAIHQGFESYALTMDYGQKSRYELNCAARVAKALGAKKHLVLKVDLASIGGSALTDDIPVPLDEVDESRSKVPITYVPARNTVLLSLALAWGETLNAFDIFIGANSVDYSGYPDCRPEFIMAFEKMANVGTQAAVEGEGAFLIQAPLLRLTKSDIVLRGLELGVDFSLTSSCYEPGEGGAACGRCDSCRIRLQGFSDAGTVDPAHYLS